VPPNQKERRPHSHLDAYCKGQEPDKVAGLELGADDYVVKPFRVGELLARIRALLRRRSAWSGREPQQVEPVYFGDVEIDSQRFQRNKGGKTFSLTARELELLCLFLKVCGQVLSRSEILEKIWGICYERTTRTLDQHIANLQKKIEDDPAHPRYIVTVHRIGYRFDSTVGAEAK
jgi:DNA-binding response OmpR family regulator